MKHTKSLIAITIMAILATTVAVVSCKKDNENNMSPKSYTVRQAADIQQIEDPYAYILDFKKKLTESKDNEAFELKDAAWHLACLANLDFCNINVEFDDFKFDTVEMQVNVTDGVILLGDLNTAYGQMCAKIQQFKKDPTHSDRNLYYANVSINAAGNAKIALMTSITADSKHLDDHLWYFSNLVEVYDACDEYFSDDSTYTWNTTAADELTRILNIYEHHEYAIPIPGGYQMCYFPTRDHTFNYSNTAYDPYGNNFYLNSRIFAVEGDAVSSNTIIITTDDMCYCLDSYLGSGYGYINDNLYSNEHPVLWQVFSESVHPNNYKWWIYYHNLYVEYGQPISINPPGPYD